jgi:hypothetical protein
MDSQDDSNFLSQVKGFTPVIDVLAEELGMMTALVYGIVWRYCQMKDRVCHASKETIGEHAKISGKTVQRHLQKLVKAGYLIDLTPDKKHAPHTYKDAGKVRIEGLVEAKLVGGTESPTSKKGGTESPTRQDRESHLGGTESPVKIESEETPKERNNHGANAEDDAPSLLLSSTPARRILKAKLDANIFKPQRRRGPQKFSTLKVAQKFDAAAARLDGSLETAIDAALEQGCSSVIRVVNYIAKYQVNGGPHGPTHKRPDQSSRSPVSDYHVATRPDPEESARLKAEIHASVERELATGAGRVP